jgi:hypothetical protein
VSRNHVTIKRGSAIFLTKTDPVAPLLTCVLNLSLDQALRHDAADRAFGAENSFGVCAHQMTKRILVANCSLLKNLNQ